eukprot:16448298-Heterocapsa_arctica.AAC.1
MAGPNDEELVAIRAQFSAVLQKGVYEPLDPNQFNCQVCGQLLEDSAAASGDPDLEAAAFPRQGAPAGILHHPGQPNIFPNADESDDQGDPFEVDTGNP